MAFEDGLNYFPDVTDADLIGNADLTPDEAIAVQAARNRLRQAGFVKETSLGVFTKNYGMTASEQQKYDDALSIGNVFAETKNTVSSGLGSLASGGAALWDGLNNTLIIVSVLVGVLTLHSLLSGRK